MQRIKSTLSDNVTIHKDAPIPSVWYVYLIRINTDTPAKVGSLYCGITTDITRRFKQHQAGKGAKYLRGKGPLTLVWQQSVSDKSTALKYELKIKALSKRQKERLVSEQGIFEPEPLTD